MWNQAGVYRRRRRTFTVSAALVVLLIIIVANSGGGSVPAPPGGPATRTVPQSSAPLSYNGATSLLAPISESAAAPRPDKSAILLMGGLDGSGDSTAGIATVSTTGTIIDGVLPVSLDAAAAVELGGQEYVIGGESGRTPTALIYDYDLNGNGEVNQAGELPVTNYGLAAAVIGSTVYIVGGYTGTSTLDAILAWKPGGGVPKLVAHLPVALAFTAVAAVGDRLVIAGGLDTNGKPSKQVFMFDPAKNNKVTVLTHLPVALYAASAATLGKLVYVIGGEPGEKMTPVNTIYSIDPSTAQVGSAGKLQGPLAQESAVGLAKTIYLAGGWNGTQAVDSVATLAPAKAKSNSKAG